MQGGEPPSPFGDGGRGDVMSGLRLRSHIGSERCRLAWVCLCQPERLSRLLSQGCGHYKASNAESARVVEGIRSLITAKGVSPAPRGAPKG